VKTRVVCEEIERERERETERVVNNSNSINKANKHHTPQIIEQKTVKEISLFWK
jgi:hypothetical protein